MIQKQNISINFSGGLDTKTDPKQVKAGKFLSLQNSVFTTGGLLQKRNGYGELPTLPDLTSNYVTTINDNLTAIGNKINSYSSDTKKWVQKGNIQPCSVDQISLVRNNLNQSQSDIAIAANGLVCTVYTEVSNTSSVGVITSYRYVIADSVTGQNVVDPTDIPVSTGTVSGSPRVFLLGNLFVVVFTNLISATSHLQYIAVSSIDPSYVTINSDIASAYDPTVALSWDGVVVNGNKLFIAYDTSSTGQSIKITYLTTQAAYSGSSPVTAKTFASEKAQVMSLCADISVPSNPVIYSSYYRTDTGLVNTFAVDQNLNTILAPTTITVSSPNIFNLASVATAGSVSVFQEVAGAYGYDPTIPTHFINGVTCAQDGTTGSVYTVLRSVGLASKAFVINGQIYFLSVYQSPFQPTYFLVNASLCTEASPVVVAKLAYENAGGVADLFNGYIASGLSNVSVSGNVARFSYLFKDLIEALTTVQDTAQNVTGGIYSQTGVNLASIEIGTRNISSSEIAKDLNISGGFLWQYDGYLPVEQNFFLWPDSIQATYNPTSEVTPTGTFLLGSKSIVVSSIAGINPGMTITDTDNATYIPDGTTVVTIDGLTSTITISNAATHAATGDNLSIQGNVAAKPDSSTNTNAYAYQVLYEWTDNQGNIHRSAPSIPVFVTTTGSATTGTVIVSIPNLRITYKTANPVKLVVYRWSVANQAYHQVTSVTTPVLNDTTTDYITFVDPLPESAVQGNSLIYTTGGVVEDVNAPATDTMTLFDNRLWLIDAEDRNLLWFSKQVIESTPVEMSDLFTIYVGPTIGVEGSTGPMTALGTMDDKLIIFKKDAIYYIALGSGGPDNTGANSGYSQPTFITSTVGCANQNSIVLVNTGLMFQSDKGIWALDRFSLQVSYIGADVEEFNSSIVESAVNVPATTQARFTLNTGETLMYDYFYNQWGTFVGIPSVSSCIYQGLHTYIDSLGRVFQETPGKYQDGNNPVLIQFTTSWINLAGISGYQRLYEFILTGNYISPHNLMVTTAFDFFPASQARLIQPLNGTGVYGSDSIYGQTSPNGGPPRLEQWRIQTDTQKCQVFQIGVQEVFIPGSASVSGAGFTMSNINCTVGVKSGKRPIAAIQTA